MKTPEEIIQSLPKLASKAITFDSDLAAAYHEAGHCTVMLAHGQVPTRVTLDPPRMHHENINKNPYFLIKMYMGGAVATALYCGIYTFSEGVDRDTVIKHIAYYRLSYDVVVQAWQETHTLLLDSRDILALIASKLHREREIGKEWFELLL
ncbi:MAG: hypothetical protein R6U58_08290 [Bacteroidales bacterium]